MIYRLVSAVLAMVVLLSGWQAAQAQEVGTILEKAIKAHGGEEALLKHKAGISRNKGTLEVMGLTLEITQEIRYQLPDKFREVLEFSVNGMNFTSDAVGNGDKVGLKVNGKEFPVNDDVKKEFKEAGNLLKATRLVALQKDPDVTLSLIGEIQVLGKPATNIKVARKGYKEIDLAFDKATDLLVRIERKGIDPMSGMEFVEERIIVEYQRQNGMPVPKKVLVNRDGKKFIEAEVVEVKLLESLPDTDFKQ